eukprot:2776882-Pleurochrysis_carterae.AAC.1
MSGRACRRTPAPAGGRFRPPAGVGCGPVAPPPIRASAALCRPTRPSAPGRESVPRGRPDSACASPSAGPPCACACMPATTRPRERRAPRRGAPRATA